MQYIHTQDKILGCLNGGAVGDAFGAPIEFMKKEEIQRVYPNGILNKFVERQNMLMFTDDTQLSLFTASGIITSILSNSNKKQTIQNVYNAYLDWYNTQAHSYNDRPGAKGSWLANQKELYEIMSPGNTCLRALSSGKCGKIKRPINDSNGCGAVMRIAPVGLLLNRSRYDIEDIIKTAMAVGSITHGNVISNMSCALMATIISNIFFYPFESLNNIIKESINMCKKSFEDIPGSSKFIKTMKYVVEFSSTDDSIENLGEGWVSDEALAIGLCAALRYHDSFKDAIELAINHGGDSDTTGSICGNILGCYIGDNNIPLRLTQSIRSSHLICEMADDIYKIVAVLPSTDANKFQQKYINFSYKR